MATASKKKILVLDDDKIQHLLLRKRIALMETDIETIFFEAADAALDFLRTNSPDIVISDINLSHSSGWDFLDRVKALDYKGKIFLLSGSIYPGDRTPANEDPVVSGFFEKPIQESDLNFILGI